MQIRYFIQGPKADAEGWYAALETAFEDEGSPLAITEIDEAKRLFEASAYLDVDEGDDRAADFAEAIGVATDRVGREDLPDKDWMADVLAGLKPVRAGQFLVHGAHDRDKVRPNDLSIEIEAGMAFGTGHHGTTAGCLTLIGEEVRRRKPRRALDLGTGSAVLAIGLAKLARMPVLATDIDPVAVKVAADNVRENGVAGLVSCVEATGFRSGQVATKAPFDLIVANVLAGPLRAMAPDFARHLAPGGRVILSGILTEQRWSVLASFATQGLYHRRTLTMGEWVTLLLSR
ncbi:[LSU ribosomal protein L11P]-lysine N-methyltransferase [Fulvimarina manganoxydans]|uniref:Ribosomal protein L11 methyltransferase n=1 Tax=Fulvimarina manganoxydans TaxID=937218 RepID=A0A1W1YDW4_9HYPH|nr:50S ribosomal protein L11 methyltransferase [Fulvimarina manganoxydans]SMC34001.1 [LSU ribosomal protein L11P]-lysine N-methyltransferase [Fulvimarina manganoxydans]